MEVHSALWMSENSLPKESKATLLKRTSDYLIGVLWLIGATLLQKFGDRLFDAAEVALGKKLLLQLACLLLFSSVYCVLLAIRSRRKKTVFDRLKPVKGKGYSIDPKTGDAVCPQCTTEMQAVYMRDSGDKLFCYVCKHGVIK